MIRVGITGSTGFVGRHLYNTIGVYADEFLRVSIPKEAFENADDLDRWVKECDVIVHLAALNRHSDPQIIYNSNVALVEKLIASLVRCESKAHIIFSSSTQEEKDNLYGKSKLAGRDLFRKWAMNSEGTFTGMIIPNVFGPFGRPYYNSVVATFCHQLTHKEIPRVDTDAELQLIYVGELVAGIIDTIRAGKGCDELQIPCTHKAKVSGILALLQSYADQYLENGVIPQLNNLFEVNLFNTFRSFISVADFFPVKFKENIDARGSFVEVIRLNSGGQISFSTTKAGVTRGNHFHTRKIERFAVIKGEALIQLRRVGTEDVFDFHLSGSAPAYVDMPVWFTHNIRNIGQDELYTIFWINEFYNADDPDTYMENV